MEASCASALKSQSWQRQTFLNITKNWTKGWRLYGDERKAFYKSYNAKIAELDKKYKGRMSDILDFLYESDCSAEMDAAHCRSIYEVIKNYDDDILYGYAGRKDCAKFADFKKIVKDGIDSGDGFSWC